MQMLQRSMQAYHLFQRPFSSVSTLAGVDE